MHQSAASAASLASAAATRDWVLRRGEQAEVKGILRKKTGVGPFETPVSLARRGIERANYVAGNTFTVTSEPFQNLLRAIWLTCLTFAFFFFFSLHCGWRTACKMCAYSTALLSLFQCGYIPFPTRTGQMAFLKANSWFSVTGWYSGRQMLVGP